MLGTRPSSLRKLARFVNATYLHLHCPSVVVLILDKTLQVCLASILDGVSFLTLRSLAQLERIGSDFDIRTTIDVIFDCRSTLF